MGPKRGPVQAKMAENAFTGPGYGPVRALRREIFANIEIISLHLNPRFRLIFSTPH